jgi:predicted small lipoprotein YifL
MNQARVSMITRARRFPAILFALLIVMLVAACGNKGPLYLPKDNPVMNNTTEPETGNQTKAAERSSADRFTDND